MFHIGAYTDLEYCELNKEDTYNTNLESVKHAVKISNNLNKRDIYKKSFQNSGKVQTSSYKLDDVLSHLECLVFRENETGSVKDVSKKYGMSHHTFRDKCLKAKKLIKSKEILRFFPK